MNQCPPASPYYYSKMYGYRMLTNESTFQFKQSGQTYGRVQTHDYQYSKDLRDIQNRIDELRNNRINYSSNNYSFQYLTYSSEPRNAISTYSSMSTITYSNTSNRLAIKY
jgi:hypothetical protein